MQRIPKASRALAILLSVLLILTLMPAVAYAEDDTTPPEWVASYPAPSHISDNEFSLKVRSNEAGKVYYVRLADGAAAPSAVQVKGGKDAAGTTLSYPQAMSLPVGANIDTSIRIRGLEPDTAYDVYAVLDDTVGNLQSEPELVEVITTIPDAEKSGITNQVMDSDGSKRVSLTVVVKNAENFGSCGYQALDFGVTVDGTPTTFAGPQFSGFNDSDNATTGQYTVVFTGAADDTAYTFADLTVAGYAIEAGPVIVTTPPAPTSAPTITGAVLDAENNYITITFSEGVYGNSDGTGAISKDDFDLTFARNGGVVSGASIEYMINTSYTPLSGGEDECIAVLRLIDGPATGAETITIRPKTNSIYNSAGVAMAATETTGAKNLNVLPAQSFAAEYPKTGVAQSPGSHAVQVLAKVALAGVVSYVVLPDGVTPPTAQQIKDHANIDGQAPISWASQGIGADIELPITMSSNLSHDTAYDVYMVAQAGNNNFSPVKKLDVRTPLETPPSGNPEWHYRSPMPSKNIIENIKFINGNYYAVGYNGTLITSADGESWQKIDVGTDTDRLTGIAYGNGKYVIVGTACDFAARIFTSDNGLNWRETASISNHWLYDVVYAEDKFVAVGQSGKILTSSDGENWNTAVIPDMDYTLLSVTYGEGLFVASGMGSSSIKPKGGIMTSTDGLTWTVKHTNTTYTLYDVTYGGGTFVAAGCTNENNYYICSSDDGNTWTQRTTGAGRVFSVDYNGTKFLAAGQTSVGNALYCTSVDGNSWASGSDITSPSFRTVTSNAAGTRYVAMGGTGNIFSSDNGGTSWTRRTLGATKTLRDVAWNGSLFVAVGSEGTIQTSPDGRNWTIRASGTSSHLNEVEYLNGRFIAVGANSTIVTSVNGVDWTSQSMGTTTELQDVTYGEGLFVAGGDATVRISSDGAVWTAPTGLISLKTVAYGNEVFLAMTEHGQVFRSEDGSTWSDIGRLYAYGSKYPTNMIYAGGKFLAVGGYGEIYLSSDNGSNWTTVVTDWDNYSFSVAYADGKYVAVGQTGKIMASADGGLNWFIQPSGLTTNPYYSDDIVLNGIAAGGDNFVAVGENGIALQSEGFGVNTDPDAHDVAYAKLKLDFNDIAGSGINDHASRIAANMRLISEGENKTDITWSSSKPEYIAINGDVTRPAFGSGDQVVYLTATISKGTASDTKIIIVNVLEQANPDIAIVDAAINTLTFDVIKMDNTAQNNIVSHLNLTTSGISGTAISWASSNSAYITTGGAVIRPAEGTADEPVTLTATISKGSVSRTRSFNLTVKALVNPDAQAVTDAKAALTFDVIKIDNTAQHNIVSNLNLTTAGINGTTISWASSNPAYITTGGAVTRPSTGTSDQPVTLTAAISKGSASDTKTFSLTVKAMTAAPPPAPGGPSGSSNSSSAPAPAYTADVSGIGTPGTLPVSVNMGSNSAAVIAGTQQGNSITAGNPVVIDIPAIPGVHSFTLEIPAGYLSAPDGEGTLTLTTDTGSVTMPSNMLATTEGEKAKVTISKGDPSGLSNDVKALIGNRPLIQLTLTMDGKQTEWNNPDAPVTVAIPYSPTAEELLDPEHIVIWYLDGSGNAVSVPSGRFDPVTGTVIFTTTHFSDYAVAYVHKTFADLNGTKWAKKAIEVMASKGIINGTENDSCSPKACITRADYMVMLVKSLGLTADFKENFADVKSGTYYYESLGIAKKLGIATGSGDNLFKPMEKISRQDMMVLAARALEKAKNLKTETNTGVLDQYGDKDRISGYASACLAALVQNGLITGNGNKLNPRGDTTRAEAAVFLYRIYNQ